MNFDNGHRQRQGQHNKNQRGRGRNNNNNNNRRPGGGQFNTGGNSINRVYESNGPDVKVRGTAQTIAEKYMQLGRDAQSSGDNVMAESYYQFSEHYFRVMAAAQPVGQPTQQLRRPEDEDMEEEGGEFVEGDQMPPRDMAEGDMPVAAEGSDASAEGQDRAAAEGERSESRNFRGRDRFRSRWPNRRAGYQQPEGQEGQQFERPQQQEAEFVAEAAPEGIREDARPVVEAREPVNEQWEAPSFLRRPTETSEVAAAPVEVPAVAETVPEKKPRQRRVKAVVEAEAKSTTEE